MIKTIETVIDESRQYDNFKAVKTIDEQISAKKEELEVVRKAIKEELKLLLNQKRMLEDSVHTGVLKEEVECEEQVDDENNVINIVRKDTGETIDTVPLKEKS